MYYVYLNTHILHSSVEYPPSGWIVVLWNVQRLTFRIWADRLPKIWVPLPAVAPESPVCLSKLCPLKYNDNPFNAGYSGCQQFSLWDDKQYRVFSYWLIGLSLWSVMCPSSWSTLKMSHLPYITNSVSHFLFMFIYVVSPWSLLMNKYILGLSVSVLSPPSPAHVCSKLASYLSASVSKYAQPSLAWISFYNITCYFIHTCIYFDHSSLPPIQICLIFMKSIYLPIPMGLLFFSNCFNNICQFQSHGKYLVGSSPL